MKISFINMVANLCEVVGADVTKVAYGMGFDPRIGPAFLNPGIGFGGFCFPKDVQAFIRIAEKSGCDFSLLKEVEKINLGRVEHFVEQVRKEMWVLRGKKIAVWGLAFKPNTDDIRFAPALSIIRRLQAEGAQIRAYDPEAMEKAEKEIPDITYCQDAYEAAKGADAVLLLTEWEEFRKIDWNRLATLVERPLIIDGRNTLSREDVVSNGFHYIGIGGISATPQVAQPLIATSLCGVSRAGPSPTDYPLVVMKALPTYVLITPARNEAKFIELTLQSMVGQIYRPLKWVIVSDGSTDGTDDLVRKYSCRQSVDRIASDARARGAALRRQGSCLQSGLCQGEGAEPGCDRKS